MATILGYMKNPTSRVKIISDPHDESHLEDDVQLNDNAFQDGRAVWKTFTDLRKSSVTKKERFKMLLLGQSLCTER